MSSNRVPAIVQVACTGHDGTLDPARQSFGFIASVPSAICGLAVDQTARKKALQELAASFDIRVRAHPANQLCASCQAPAIGCQHTLYPRLHGDSNRYLIIDIVVALCPKVGCRAHGNDFSNLIRSLLANPQMSGPDETAASAARVIFVSPPLAGLAKQVDVSVFVVDEPTIPAVELVEFVPAALCLPKVSEDTRLPYVAEITKRIVARLKEMKLPWKCVGSGQVAKTCLGSLGLALDEPVEEKKGFYLAVAFCRRGPCMKKAEEVAMEIRIVGNTPDVTKPRILQGNAKKAMDVCAFCGGKENIQMCAGCKAVG